jgi:YebC/PmpR family DNA-binding regulatory protein
MSGHSKWKTIQHKKAAEDAKKGKAFSKISKELMVEAKRGGSDPNTNAALRALIQKAKGVNMPADNVMRAIKKGAGELEGASYEETMYEGYAAGGVGLVVACLTDNRNRTAAEIRHMFSRHGSSLAGVGAVSRGFERKGQIFVDASAVDEDKLMTVVLDAGADDMSKQGDQFQILTSPSTFVTVCEAMEKAGIPKVSAELGLVPGTLVPVTDKAVANSVMKFVSDLEDHDDVQNVYTNMDVSDELAKELDEAS